MNAGPLKKEENREMYRKDSIIKTLNIGSMGKARIHGHTRLLEWNVKIGGVSKSQYSLAQGYMDKL